MTSATRASVMCTLCGAAGTIDTDVDTAEGVASAGAWAVHFILDHPEVGSRGLSQHLVMTPTDHTDGSR